MNPRAVWCCVSRGSGDGNIHFSVIPSCLLILFCFFEGMEGKYKMQGLL